MNIVLDLIVLLIVVFLIIGGYKRGVLKTVIELGGAILSSLIASFGGSLIAVNLYDSFVKQQVIDAVQKSLPDLSSITKTAEIADGIFSSAPSYVTNSFELLGIDINSLTKEIGSTTLEVPAMVESMVRPVLIKLFTVVVTIVLFAVIATIVALVSKAVTSAMEDAGLGGANRFFGAVIGLAEAVILIMIMSMVLYFLTVMLPTDYAQGLRDAIDSTYIYKLIYYINVPDMIITKIISV